MFTRITTSLVICLVSFGIACVQANPTDALAGPKQVDHTRFNALLHAHVKGDSLNYAALVGDADLQTYVKVIGETDPNRLGSKDAKLAFYINAYNALTITSVLSHWPKITSVSSIKPDFTFFKEKVHRIGGKLVSLNEIENEIIRPTFKDPRIHAALNCASISCPPLPNFAFDAQHLGKQLDTVFRAFANDNVRNQVDPVTGSIQLSKILDWYKADFKSAGGSAKYLSGFATDPARKATLANPKKTGFLEYDWNLNQPQK
jgi:hypothetical protein